MDISFEEFGIDAHNTVHVNNLEEAQIMFDFFDNLGCRRTVDDVNFDIYPYFYFDNGLHGRHGMMSGSKYSNMEFETWYRWYVEPDINASIDMVDFCALL